MLALPEIPHGYDYEKVVLHGIVLGKKPVVAAGRSFFDRFEKRVEESDENNESERKSVSESDCESPKASEYRQRNKKKDQLYSGNALRLSALVRDINLYSVLAVSESCTGDDIKKSYRKLVLEKHPDKQQSLSPQEAEKVRTEFLRIQEAFEVLSDDKKRRMYDSSIPFDDTIPNEKDITSEDDFYAIFSAAFSRNQRWSTRRPVPSLGSPDASRNYVENFYDFWYNKFETWRDFSHHDEHDLSHAESRDERRWMEVQNARIRKKKLGDENARIRKMVELAEKLDPRMKRFKQEDAEAVAEEKRRRQQEREERQRIEDEKRQEIERKKMEQLMEEEIKKEKDKIEKSEIKKIRSEIRQTLNTLGNEKFNQSLLALLTTLEKARDTLELAKTAIQNNTVESFIEDIIQDASALSRTCSVVSTPAPEIVLSPPEQEEPMGWTSEEVQLLTRGMQKYPVGTNRRWEIIQGLVGGSKTVAQVIEMSKIVASKKVVEVKELIPSKTKNYQAAVPDVDYERSAVKPAETPDEWSGEQQKQLEEAMRKFPATLPPAERWAKIAECVPGKTKQQCVARFKYIRELIAKKK
jgi:DnaJ family protein C protein 2